MFYCLINTLCYQSERGNNLKLSIMGVNKGIKANLSLTLFILL